MCCPMMDFDSFDQEQRFREAWEAVKIERPVHYGLFTFGDSVLPYFLVCSEKTPGKPVSVTKGEVRISRPRIITPDSMHPEFRNFFEDGDDDEMIAFLLARSAAFSNLKLDNASGPREFMSDRVEDVVGRLNRQLDDDEEDRVGVLSAPRELAGVAVLRFAAERVWESGPGNIQELRERGLLP